MKTFLLRTAVAVLFFTIGEALALGPHECVILVNRRSMESVELANFYAELRNIPAGNIIHLDLPPKALEARPVFTPSEFNEYILEPARKVLRDRNIIGHVLVWIYSSGFPTTISTEPPISLTGMTFTRGVTPTFDEIEKGTWASPMFRGPHRADGPSAPSVTFEEFTLHLGTEMPTPSMMLGWTGSRGMTVEQIRQQLRASASSDGAHPPASVFFELNNDPRSRARQWQFEPIAKELAGMGITAIIATNPPVNRPDLMGILAGRSHVDPSQFAAVLRPGAYADHLTSLAAYFHEPDQTKLTAWLKHQAAGSSGTIHEPYANWAKFPSARLFAHYAGGCSLIESLYQSIRSPLQILPVGDPLCSPWMKPPGLTLLNMADDEKAPLKGKAEFVASSWSGFGQVPPTTIFFLDGRPVNQPGAQQQFSIDTERLNDGYHDLRAVAYANESIRHQGFDTKGFISRNRNRGVSIGGYTNRQEVDYYRPVRFQIQAEGSPREAAIIAQERVLAREAYSSNMSISVNLVHVGPGPVRFQAVVVYPDNEAVRSVPLLLDIRSLNQAPEIHAFHASTNETGDVTFTMAVSDPDDTNLEALWYNDILKGNNNDLLIAPMDLLAEHKVSDISVLIAATSGVICTTYQPDQPNLIREIRMSMTPLFTPTPHLMQAGIVFNYQDANNYMFWGASGYFSAWTLIRVRDGKNEMVLTRGAPIEMNRRHDVMILALDSKKMALFANENLMAIADVSFGAGRVGGLASTPVQFDNILVAPPSAMRPYFSESQKGLLVDSDHLNSIASIYGGVRDVQLTTVRRLSVTAD
ncbi:MAG TPA: hypothetical protein PJ991_02565 [Kiritimatiellia bacterium]|nr:hypothetical protein [Kiritimatiellia bacterium]